MFLLYADASGTREIQDISSRHYVLLGVCVHEGTWFGLNARVERLKSRYCPPGLTFELHATQFCVWIREQDQIPNFAQMSWTERRNSVTQLQQARIAATGDGEKRNRLRERYRHYEPFIHLTRLERSRLFEETLDLVGSHDRIRLFAEAVSKGHPLVRGEQIDPVRQAFEQVVTRFDRFLQWRHEWQLQRSDRPSINNGLLILDDDDLTEKAIQQQFDGFRLHGHPWGNLRHVVDVPFYASSQRLAGLQLADICAYALRRYLDTGAVAGSHEERNFNRIVHRFDRGSDGRLHGLRHYVQSGTCSCVICQLRGHGPEGPTAELTQQPSPRPPSTP